MTKQTEALKLALETLQFDGNIWHMDCKKDEAITAIKEALAQEQEPVAYDKTELNCFAQDLYDQKMREGKRGHYESMFHVIHQCIKKVAPPPPQRTWVGLTDEDISEIAINNPPMVHEFARAVLAKSKELNA